MNYFKHKNTHRIKERFGKSNEKKIKKKAGFVSLMWFLKSPHTLGTIHAKSLDFYTEWTTELGRKYRILPHPCTLWKVGK